MLSSAIRSKVDALWDRFWSGGIANPLTAIEQISYLLFMRRLDESDRARRKAVDFGGGAKGTLGAVEPEEIPEPAAIDKAVRILRSQIDIPMTIGG